FVSSSRFATAGSNGAVKLWELRESPGDPILGCTEVATIASHVWRSLAVATPRRTRLVSADKARLALVDLEKPDLGWTRALSRARCVKRTSPARRVRGRLPSWV